MARSLLTRGAPAWLGSLGGCPHCGNGIGVKSCLGAERGLLLTLGRPLHHLDQLPQACKIWDPQNSSNSAAGEVGAVL